MRITIFNDSGKKLSITVVLTSVWNLDDVGDGETHYIDLNDVFERAEIEVRIREILDLTK